MPYTIHNSDGTVLTTLADQNIDTTTTSVALVGRDALNYGQPTAENFVHLMQNFASPNPPNNPLFGQFWVNTGNNTLNMYAGAGAWVTILTVTNGSSNVSGLQLVSTAPNGTAPFVINSRTKVVGLNADLLDGYDTSIPLVASTIPVRDPNGDLFANVFHGSATQAANATLLAGYGAASTITPLTIALRDANGDLWGNVFHGMATSAQSAQAVAGFPSSTTATANTVALRDSGGSLTANYFRGIATSALYADLAERFEASIPLMAGDVVTFGGDKAITRAVYGDDVLGVVSANPGFRMNEDAGSDQTHPFVAYVGQVPVRVTGTVKKGDRLYLSTTPGVACAYDAAYAAAARVGIAMTDSIDGPNPTVMAVVGR